MEGWLNGIPGRVVGGKSSLAMGDPACPGPPVTQPLQAELTLSLLCHALQKARRASYLVDVEAGPPGGGDKGGPGGPGGAGGGRGGAHDKLRSPMPSGVDDIASRPTSIDGPRPGGISPAHSMRQRDIAPETAEAIRAAMLAVFDGGGGGVDADGMGRRHASATDVGDGLQRSDSWVQPLAPRTASHVDAAGPRGGAAAAAAAMRFSGAGTAAAASGNSSRWRMSRFGRNAGAGGATASGLAGHDSPMARSRSKTASGLITSDPPAEAVLKQSVSVPPGSALLRASLAEHATGSGAGSGPNTPPWARGRRRVEVITGHDDDDLMVLEPEEAGDEEDVDTLGLGPFTQDGEVVSFSKGSGGGPSSAGALPLPLAGSSDGGKGAEAVTGAEGKGGKEGKEDEQGKEKKKKKGFLGFRSKKKKAEPNMASNPTYKPAYMVSGGRVAPRLVTWHTMGASSADGW